MPSSFTPGPWLLADGFPSVEARTAPHLALCNDPAIPMPERRANARLIAAAPDLHSIVKKLLDARNKAADVVAFSDMVDEFIDAAATAIARAEGRE